MKGSSFEKKNSVKEKPEQTDGLYPGNGTISDDDIRDAVALLIESSPAPKALSGDLRSIIAQRCGYQVKK